MPRRAGHAEHDPKPGVEPEQAAKHDHHIGAEAEEAGMTQRHQAGEAEQEVEAHGEDAEDEELGDKRALVVGDEHRINDEGCDRHQAREQRATGFERRFRCRARRGRRGRVHDAEQTLRPRQQHGRHHQIDEEQRQLRRVGLAEGVGLADLQAADESAAQAAHAADDDDDESRNQNIGVLAGIHADDRAGGDPAERGERHARAEDRGKERRDVAAQPSGHCGVVDAGADHRADSRAFEKEPQHQRDHGAERDEEKPIGREHAGAERDDAVECGRRRQSMHVAAPDRLHYVEEDERETESQQNLIEVAAAVERAQEADFHRDADNRNRNWRQQERQPKAAGQPIDREADVAAQHEERAVREAHDVHETEDQRQPRRGQEQQDTVDDAVEELIENEFHDLANQAGSGAAAVHADGDRTRAAGYP
jgi:hypothetical protein